MEPALSPTTSTKVFTIPDLIYSISRFTEFLELTRLLQVSHLTFALLAPVAWKHVHGAQKLLSLIKGSSLHYDDAGKLDEIALNQHGETPGPNPFERFDFYAPHVQILDVYYDKSHTYGVSGWELLLSEAQRRALLPNLKTLSKLCVMTNKSFPREYVETRWISAFVTDSVLEFTPHIGLWKISTSSAVLGTLVRQTSRLEMLTLHFNDHIDDDDDDDDDDNDDSNPDHSAASYEHWYKYLPFLQELRHLDVSEGWLYPPCLLALGQLPKLEFIKLRPGVLAGVNTMFDLDANLPCDLFPALRHMTLFGLNPYSIIRTLGVREMLKSITKLDLEFELEFELQSLDDEDELRRRFLVHSLLPLLKNVPCLKQLCINVFSPAGVKYMIHDPAVMSTMAALPLEGIFLGAIHIGTGVLEPNLRNIWPNITSLRMPSQYASLQELSYFATLPSLKLLVVQLDITTTFIPENIPNSNAPLTTIFGSKGNKISTRFEVLEHNVRVLQLLWPKIHVVQMFADGDSQMQKLVWNFDLLVGLRSAIRSQYGTGPVPELSYANRLLSVIREISDSIRAEVGESRSDLDASPRISVYEP